MKSILDMAWSFSSQSIEAPRDGDNDTVSGSLRCPIANL